MSETTPERGAAKDEGGVLKSVPPLAPIPPAAQDPIRAIVDIITDERIRDADKRILIEFSQERFHNRRRMAYLSLYAIFAIAGFLALATLLDPFVADNVLASLKEINALLISIIGFLTSVVIAYIGAAALRPSS